MGNFNNKEDEMKTAATLGLTMILFWLSLIGTAIYGAVLAFQESIILGFASLLLPPSPLIFGFVSFFGTNIPHALQLWIKFPV